MDITIYRGRTPELGAADIRVVIDVIRAFTTTHVALRRGARSIWLAETVDDARRLAAAGSGRVLAGERNALAPPGFDLGNSPAEMAVADVTGREVVLTTTNGVRATLHAAFDGPLIVTGFSNGEATVRHLRSLIAGGRRRIQLIASHPTGDEDLACAQWIGTQLTGGHSPDADAVRRRILDSRAAAKFLDPNQPLYRSRDIDYCRHLIRSPWAMVAGADDGTVVVERRRLNEFSDH